MNSVIEEIRRKRSNFVVAAKENGIFEGIKKLLVKIFPLGGLFIYELIQNAEDMDATAVKFELFNDKLIFKHNGTKRNFTKEDIYAITGVFNSLLKIDDPTAIGKFGLGFKSVYLYTDEPKIHSGSFHFNIRDYFVPEEIDDRPSLNAAGERWTTLFVFPLGKKDGNMDAKQAYDRIAKSLGEIDYRTLIFLKHMCHISYVVHLGNGISYVEGHVEKVRLDDKLVRVSSWYNSGSLSPQVKGNVNDSYWLLYTKEHKYLSEYNVDKLHSIGVAYRANLSKNCVDKLLPVEATGHDKVYAFFPCSKEPTGLKFLINAPFSTTPDRTQLTEEHVNDELIKKLARLIVESFDDIKRSGWLNVDFLAVLPNTLDNIASRFKAIQNSILEAFTINPLLPTLTGGFVDATHARITQMGMSDIYKCFNDEAMRQIFGNQEKWLARANLNSGREERFYESLPIKKVTYADFLRAFDPPNRERFEGFIKSKWRDKRDEKDGLRYFVSVYSLLNKALRDHEYASRVMPCKIFLSGTPSHPLCFGNEIYLPEIGKERTSCLQGDSGVYFVHPELLKNSDASNLFNIRLRMPHYGTGVIIKKVLDRLIIGTKDIANGQEVSLPYFRDLLSIAKYYRQNPTAELPYRDTPFYVEGSKPRILFAVAKADRVYVSSPYQNIRGWDVVGGAYGKMKLASVYKSKYSVDELEIVVDFIKKLGGLFELKIVRNSDPSLIVNHPEYKTKLYQPGQRRTNPTCSDYTIPELDRLLSCKNPHVSELIWKVLRANRNRSEYAEATYSRTGNANDEQTCDSTLIYTLRNRAWVPVAGMMRKPEEVDVPALPKEFLYDRTNRLLAALKFGEANRVERAKRQQLEDEAKKIKCRVISEEDFQKLQGMLHEPRPVTPIDPEIRRKQFLRSIIDVPEQISADFSRLINSNILNEEQASKKILAKATEAKNSIVRRRFTSCIISSDGEKNQLNLWYRGQCQVCKERILRVAKSGTVAYFVACNICVAPKEWIGSEKLAWNSLSLCPSCAAKFKYSPKMITPFLDAILTGKNIKGEDLEVEAETGFKLVPLKLNGEFVNVRFNSDHLLRANSIFTELLNEATEELSKR